MFIKTLKQIFILLPCFILLGVLAGCMSNTNYILNKQKDKAFLVGEWKGTCKISYSSFPERNYTAIDESTYEAFVNLVADLEKRDCKTKEIMFSSYGGNVNAAIKIGLLINKHGYHTTLQLGEGCSSACGIIFIAGKERIALTSNTLGVSSIGFHQMSKPDATGKRTCSEPTGPEYKIIENYSLSILSKNISSEFISLMKSTSCKSMTYIKADGLVKNGIATKINGHMWGI
jgi:hypothetical protein